MNIRHIKTDLRSRRKLSMTLFFRLRFLSLILCGTHVARLTSYGYILRTNYHPPHHRCYTKSNSYSYLRHPLFGQSSTVSIFPTKSPSRCIGIATRIALNPISTADDNNASSLGLVSNSNGNPSNETQQNEAKQDQDNSNEIANEIIKISSFPPSPGKDNSDRWLTWIGHTCNETVIGQLPQNVIKDFPPVMNIYAKQRSKEGAENAEQLLLRLLKESKAGNEAVNATMTSTVFNVAIDAWAKSGTKESGQRAERIFSLMDQICKEGKHLKVRQDTISFTSVIDAWANSNIKGSAQRACDILNLMEKLSFSPKHDKSPPPPRPNRVTYNVCLSALAKSHERNSATEAEKIVERMEYLYNSDPNNTSIKPDVVSYQSLIFAWSNSREWGAPQRAEEILKNMDDLHKTTGDKSLRPNVYCFTAAINAWSKSMEKDKVERAWNILQYMKKLHQAGDIEEGPNVYTYTSVINTACYPCIQGADKSEVEEMKSKAFVVALKTMEEMLESENVRPNHVTYGAFLNACHRLLSELDDRRMSVVERVFLHAKEDGQVGRVVLQKLWLVIASREKFVRLLSPEEDNEDYPFIMMIMEDENFDMEAIYQGYLLPEWKCNVKGEKIPINYVDEARKSRYSTPLSRRGSNIWKMRGKSGYYSK